MSMLFLRPVREDDLPALLALSRHAGHGLTTLPTDERILARRVRKSLESFARLDEEPEPSDAYLLVMEDAESGRVVGTSGIVSKVGGYEPFYAYRIETSVHESRTLGVRKEVHTLHLVAEHAGPTEIGTLFLDPNVRSAGAGRLLSLGRFLLIAEHPRAFDETVIAELRGVIDEQGRSPFWEALGRHFFDVDLATADVYSVDDKSFIADLMPVHPIYIPLLPPEAQAVIGRVHPQTEPALHLLRSEGFRDAGMVDIFEAGPAVACARDEIRTIRESRTGRIARIGPDPAPGADAAGRAARTVEALVARRRPPIRVARGLLTLSETGLELPTSLARGLDVEPGEELRHAPLRASPEPTEPEPGAIRGRAVDVRNGGDGE